MATKKKAPKKKVKAKKDILTPNQEVFCQERVNPLNYNNKSKAYQIAFPRSQNWSMNTVYVKACNLDKQDKIQVRIKELREKFEEEQIASINEILHGLTLDVRFDSRKLAKENGDFKRLHELDEETALSLGGFEEYETISTSEKGNETVNRRIKYKFPDKNKAREMLGRFHGMFEKDNEQKATGMILSISEEDKKELLLPRTEKRVTDILKTHKKNLKKKIEAIASKGE